MLIYVTLLNWTDQGIANVKESPTRLDAAKKPANDLSGKFNSADIDMM